MHIFRLCALRTISLLYFATRQTIKEYHFFSPSSRAHAETQYIYMYDDVRRCTTGRRILHSRIRNCCAMQSVMVWNCISPHTAHVQRTYSTDFQCDGICTNCIQQHEGPNIRVDKKKEKNGCCVWACVCVWARACYISIFMLTGIYFMAP